MSRAARPRALAQPEGQADQQLRFAERDLLDASSPPRIVEARGAAIGFDSQPDAGSRFWFVLPRA